MLWLKGNGAPVERLEVLLSPIVSSMLPCSAWLEASLNLVLLGLYMK